MKLDSLRELLEHELGDLYDAEQQISKALPKLAEAAHSDALKEAFSKHQTQTLTHIARLEKSFQHLAIEPKRVKCEAIRGLLKEGEEFVKATGDPAVLDAGLIAAAQRVEHYEMAGYGCTRAYATELGLSAVADLLNRTLQEEKATDEALTDLALIVINPDAADGASSPDTQSIGRV